MKKGKLLYEGKAKKVYETDDPDFVWMEFTDRATAFNAQKMGTISAKGVVNNRISAKLFQVLESKGVATHFLQLISENEMVVRRLQIIPVEVTVRNRVAGGMAKLFGMEEGHRLACPVYELHYKSDALGDPLINEYHIVALQMATEEELKVIRERSFQVNNILRHFFEERGMELVDFKLEFGRARGKILLGDEISPDTCRLWEMGTGKKMDKDRFRQDLGDVESVYQEVLQRVLKG